METQSSPKFSLSMSQSKDAIFNFAYKRGNTHNNDKWITVTAIQVPFFLSHIKSKVINSMPLFMFVSAYLSRYNYYNIGS